MYPHYSIQSSLSALKIPALHVFIFPFFPLYKPLAMTSLLQLSPYFCLFHKVAFFKAKYLCHTLAEKPIKSATRNTELLENYFMNNKGRCHLTSVSSQRTRIYSWMESWMWKILSEITYVQNTKQILTSVLHIYEEKDLIILFCYRKPMPLVERFSFCCGKCPSTSLWYRRFTSETEWSV